MEQLILLLNAYLSKHITQINLVMYIFMITGVIASSISGVFRAVEARMDITGAILLAFLNSNAGGTLRDLILDKKVFWIEDQFYIWITFTVGVLTFIIVFYRNKVVNSRKLHKLLIITDAMGLSAFCLAGVQKTIATYGYNDMYPLAIMMGIWTAIGGGVTADIISNRIPLVFYQELYITVAFIGSICYLLLTIYFKMNPAIAGIFSAIIMISLRLYSVKHKISLPIIK